MMTARQIVSLVSAEAHQLEPAEQRRSFESALIIPVREERQFETDVGIQQTTIWIIANLPRDGVAVAYSERDFWMTDRCWGLVLSKHPSCGSSGAWYKTLRELIDDSGYF